MNVRAPFRAILLIVLVFSSLPLVASDQPTLFMARLDGSVSVNGVAQTGGARAVAAGDVLQSGRGSATILFGPGEIVAVDQNSTVRLQAGERGIRVELQRGRLQVNGSPNRMQDVRLADRSISVHGQPGRNSQYLVSRLPQGDFVYAKLGNVSMREELLGRTTEIPEGRVGMTSEPAGAPPQTGADHAGKVAASVPSGYIMRASQKTSNNSGDDVRWNDEMFTESKGRTRVTLDDGSILSLGSNSHMKVVQHDANAQQTQLELAMGRMRVQATKLTKPGASFTVKTPTATAGVIGTDFFIEYDGKRTKVVVLEGVVKLTPIAAAIAVSVLAGQTSAVAGSTASAPVAASASQISSATSSTATSSAGAAAAASASTVVVTTAAVVPVAATAAITTATATNSATSASHP